MVFNKLANFDSEVLSCKVNGVEATVGLLTAFNHTATAFNNIGSTFGGPDNLSRGTLFYILVLYNSGELRRWFMDEGSGTALLSEEGQAATIDVGTEGVDFEWVT